MKIQSFKRLFFTATAAVLLLAIASCSDSEPGITIKGEVKNAGGKMLYLAHSGIKGMTLLDSVKLDESGEFEFHRPKLESFEFYHIGIRNEGSIIIVAEGEETITINADAKKMGEAYTITGSEESKKIQKINGKMAELEKEIARMVENTTPERMKTLDRIDSLIAVYKEEFVKEYIAPAPNKASAYYTLMLQINSTPIFNPYSNKADSRYYAAVATALENLYPKQERTRHLVETAKKGVMAHRTVTEEEIDSITAEVKTSGMFEITLPNREEKEISLSSLSGKAVLLDFTIYNHENSDARNRQLKAFHDKYREKGFEIYQISFDSHSHYWKQIAKEYPWICVHAGKKGAEYLTLYNVSSVPTFFLINRNSEVVMRDVQIEDMHKEIEKLLNEKAQ